MSEDLKTSVAWAVANPRKALAELDRIDSLTLAGFIKRSWHVVEPATPYEHGWHVDAICEHLEAVTRGEITRLGICVPPGCMKSLTVSVFWPAWEWGPMGRSHLRYLGTAHNDRLAVRDNLRCRRLIESSWYQERWPVQLTSDQNAKIKFENEQLGFRECMPFTSLTGSRGNRIIIDDPMSVDDAFSDPVRESVLTTFREAVPSRLNDQRTDAIVMIMQRLHERDPIGFILDSAMAQDYTMLVLPMEFEADRRCTTKIGFKDPRQQEGELLFPQRFPREVVEREKRTMGSWAVASQYQQRPAPRGGGMFKRDWFEIIEPWEVPPHCEWVRGWDFAATEKSGVTDPAYTAGVRLGRAPDSVFYVSNVVRGQWGPGDVEREIKNAADRDGIGTTIDIPQDPGQAGKSQVSYFKKALAGYTIYSSPESGSKIRRAEPVSSQAESRFIKIARGDWNEAFLRELETFPHGAKMDQVDALSRAFARLTKIDDEPAPHGPVTRSSSG